MAEVAEVPKAEVLRIESKPLVAEPKKPIGLQESAMAGIAARRENPDTALRLLAGEKGLEKPRVSLITDLSQEGRARILLLRDVNRVGKEKYGESSVSKFQKGKNTFQEHEEAQALAYKAYQEKIDAGLVEPSLIGTEMCLKLGVNPDLERVPETYGGIAEHVTEELRAFRETSSLTEEEFETIRGEIVEYSDLYGKAYGTENITKAYEVTRDNARKLLYQHIIDKTVFVGSDHGLRHIVNGNIRFGKQMIGSLRENGVVVSATDEVLIHQAIIDHDLGYTVGAALAPMGFGATTDHPLAGARFIEDNREYYVDKFGEDGYSAIHDSVVNHSYPRLEYQSDGQENVHEGLIRGISSTVDSLGVTVETKTPEFFWKKDAMRTLLKIRLTQETMGGKVPEEHMGRYRQELMGVAGQEQNPDRRAGYENAINNFFNEFTVNNVLGQYTGVVRKVQVEEVEDAGHEAEEDAHGEHGHEGEDKRFRVVVEMTPTEVYALLGNMFGDRLANQSFVKAAKDLGLDPKQIDAHARAIRGARSRGGVAETLEVKSDNARVVFGNEFLENQGEQDISDVLDAKKIQTISEVFHEVETLSIRTEINELLDNMKDRGAEAIPEIQARFEQFISSKTTANELRALNELFINLSDSSLTGEKDTEGSDITVSNAATNSLRGFVTQREKEFLGI